MKIVRDRDHRLSIEFTKREQETLRRAAAIGEAFREKLVELYGKIDADDLDIDTLAAGIEHGAERLIEGAADLPFPVETP